MAVEGGQQQSGVHIASPALKQLLQKAFGFQPVPIQVFPLGSY
jgi:hypothetical protein